MGASVKHRQTIVGKSARAVEFAFDMPRDIGKSFVNSLEALVTARAIEQSMPSRGKQPCFGYVRHAVIRPALESLGECVRECVLSGMHVARTRDETRQYLAITLSSRTLGRATGGLLRDRTEAGTRASTGRRSIVPTLPPGNPRPTKAPRPCPEPR
jgi:hypothetical protein